MCDIKTLLTVTTVLVTLKAVRCGCSDESKNGGDSEGCWYTFWYVWVALGLFITVIITIVIVYYKHKWSRKRTRVRRISVIGPQNPPPYTAPSQQPPSYEDALKTSYPVPPGYTGDVMLDGYIAVIPNRMRRQCTDDSSVLSGPPAYEVRAHR